MKKRILRKSLVATLVASSLLVASCGGEEKKKNDASEVKGHGDENNDGQEPNGFEMPGIPTPNDLFDIVKSLGVEQKPGITNDVALVSNYVDSKSKALNFGVYSADLGYISCFEAGPDFLSYFDVIRKLGDDLGISAAFDQSIMERIESNEGNLDSLFSISNDTYFESYAFLEENGKGKELGLIIAGGWIESMYLIFELSGDYKEDNVLNMSIADQQIILESILEFLSRYPGDDMQDVQERFSNILMSYTENMTYEAVDTEIGSEGDKMVLGGGSEFTMNEVAYNEIRTQVVELRNYIIQK